MWRFIQGVAVLGLTLGLCWSAAADDAEDKAVADIKKMALTSFVTNRSPANLLWKSVSFRSLLIGQ